MKIALETSVHAVEFVSFDVETTGLNGSNDHIVDLAGVRATVQENKDTFNTLVKPPVLIPQDLSDRVHGITDEMVSRSPPIQECMFEFLDFIQGSILVGHNVFFDLSFINSALARMQEPLLEGFHLIDTVKVAQKAFPKAPNYKLETLVEYLQLKGSSFHRALEDSQHAMNLLRKCIDELGIMGELSIKEIVLQ